MRRRAAVLALLAALLLVAAPAVAAACPRTSVSAVENEVMCPVCHVPLSVATDSPQAQRERAFVRAAVDRCESKDQIKAALVAQFGEAVLALPPARGFDLTAYVVPALAVLAALAAVAAATVRWRRRRPLPGARPGEPGAPPLAGLDPAASARLEADLHRYDV